MKRVYDVYIDSPDCLAYKFERNKELVGVITASIRWAFFTNVSLSESLGKRRTRAVGGLFDAAGFERVSVIWNTGRCGQV